MPMILITNVLVDGRSRVNIIMNTLRRRIGVRVYSACTFHYEDG